MNPTPGDVYVSRPLTRLAVAYMQRAPYVARTVFPMIPVDTQAGSFRKYNREDWLRSEAQERAPATESVGSGWRFSDDTYRATIQAVHKDIDDQTRANQQDPVNLDRDATRWVSEQLQIRQEQIFASKYMVAGVWGTDRTGVAAAPAAGQFLQFDQAASTPISYIRSEIRAMGEATGYRPNVLVMGARVLDALLEHASIIERIKYTQAGFVSVELLARALEVDRIVVPEAIQNTAAEGLTGVYSYITNSKSMLLAYANPNPSPLTVSAGYTFTWTGKIGAAPENGVRIKRFRIEEIESDRVEGELSFDPKVVASDLGRFYASAVA